MTQEAEKERKAHAEAYLLLESDKENIEAHWKGVVKCLEDRNAELQVALERERDVRLKAEESYTKELGLTATKERQIVGLKARLYDLREQQERGKANGEEQR